MADTNFVELCSIFERLHSSDIDDFDLSKNTKFLDKCVSVVDDERE